MSWHGIQLGLRFFAAPRAMPSRRLRRQRVDWAVALATVIVAMTATPAHADVRLPKLVGNRMVLQRDIPLFIWGWADPGEQVRIAFRGSDVVVRTSADRRWSAQLPRQRPGGPFKMRISGHNRIVLTDVLVGDVWLAAGQSNMEFSLAETDRANEALAGPFNPRVRLFQIPHIATLTPADDLSGDGWQAADATTSARFSAIAYLFGRDIAQRYDVPVGLVEAAWGGTYAESWIRPETLATLPSLAKDLAAFKALGPNDVADVDRYHAAYAAWNAAHRTEDGGFVDGRAIWAAPELDMRAWEPIRLPRPDSAWGTDFKRFDGAVWFRHALDIPAKVAGQAITLALGIPYAKQRAFWNGTELTALTNGGAATYNVPPELVRAGRVVVSFRLIGGGGYIMVSGNDDSLYARAGDWRAPLSGEWRYRIATDIGALPPPPAAERFLGSPGVAVIWNGMVAPITPFPIKGVLWYQGESNVGAAGVYGKMFPALVASWRAAWKQQFPFLFVQIAGYDGYAQPAAELREAQARALRLPGTAMATAADLGNAQDIHPKNKQDVADRLVLAARKVAYHEAVEASGPTLRGIVPEGGTLRVLFKNAAGGLVVRAPGPLRGFTIAGLDGRFVPAEARIDGTAVVLRSPGVARPLAVRYGWANTPDGTLGNRAGLPAAPFRSPMR